MRALTKAQLATVVVSIILIVLLYFAPKKNTSTERSPEEKPHNHTEGLNFEGYVDSVKGTLGPEIIGLVAKPYEALNRSGSKEEQVAALDSIARFWVELKQPGIVAFYTQKKAEITNTTNDWMKAGAGFSGASKFAHDHYKKYYSDQAILSYEAALRIDSASLKAKTGLGVAYVEGSADPMKGIMLLREVLAKDSNNIDAHINLGFFSIQSGQYEKAIDRFDKVLEIDKDFIPAYLYKGEAYAAMGNKEMAIESLEKYKSFNTNKYIIEEIDKYIKEIKTN
jgi:tetratricopeptide (TPR) repeat protein